MATTKWAKLTAAQRAAALNRSVPDVGAYDAKRGNIVEQALLELSHDFYNAMSTLNAAAGGTVPAQMLTTLDIFPLNV
jgi:hypothetical protein